MSARVAAATASLLDIQARSKAAATALRRAQRAEKQRTRRQFSNTQMRVARSLICLCNGQVDHARLYLQTCEPSAQSTVEAKLHEITSWWCTTTQDELSAWTSAPACAAERHALRAAKAFLTDKQLHRFVEDANMSQGIAPVTAVLLNELQDMSLSVHAASDPSGMPRKRRSQCQWLRRWRHRWDVTRGRLAVREEVPHAEAHSKAT